MNLFEYLGVFISIIIGLAVVHLISGIGKVVHRRHEVRVYWIHLLWVLNIFIYLIAFWWFLFYWSQLEEWSFLLFLFVIGYAVTLYLVAVLLFPDEIGAGVDFRAHFFQTHSWFFGAQAVAALLDMAETTLKSETGLREIPGVYFAFVPSIFLLSLAAARTTSPRFHGGYVVFYLLAQTAYVIWGFRTM